MNEKEIEEYIKQLWNSRINKSDRKITLWTGKEGYNLFNRWIRLDTCKKLLKYPLFSNEEIEQLRKMLNSEDNDLVDLGIAIIETKAKSKNILENDKDKSI